MELNMSEKDLGNEMFWAKWPTWLRWILVLPAAILAPFLFLLAHAILSFLFLGMGEDAFYWSIFKGVAWGAGFVWVGAAMAPKHQKAVSLILVIFVALLSGVSVLSILSGGKTFNEIIEVATIIISAGVVTFHIFKDHA